MNLPASLAGELIRFCLALWVGGTLLVVMAAPVLFRRIPSRDLAGEIFGELLRRFEAVKHGLSLALVIAVFVRLEQQRELAGSGAGAAFRRWQVKACRMRRHCRDHQ